MRRSGPCAKRVEKVRDLPWSGFHVCRPVAWMLPNFVSGPMFVDPWRECYRSSSGFDVCRPAPRVLPTFVRRTIFVDRASDELVLSLV